jgi:diaminohydroxyphosphoribosylaminopyrimidine deaminase/5-amino-6-(5-phosphoribosylamino)uracil reductase
LNNEDEKFMRTALRLAKRGLGRTSPNPAVGAVIVRDGQIVAKGYHKRAGEDHAEIVALKEIDAEARATDTLYVTLEPCNHAGKTPPCTAAIHRSGLRRVVIGMADPNPKVTGGGCGYLERAGIEVKLGVLEAECRRLNEAFVKYVTSGRPFVSAKLALTLDGWIATSTGHSRWISNEQSRRFVHRLRDKTDGVMVGVGTVTTDDPMLTTRIGRFKGKDPVRVVVDTHLRIPAEAKVLKLESRAETLVVAGTDVPPERVERVSTPGVSIVQAPTRQGRIDLVALMPMLGKMQLASVMVEGGSTLIGSLIRDRLIDKFYIFTAPKILGGSDGIAMASGSGPLRMDECLRLKDIAVRRMGDDVLISGYPDY